MLLRMCWRLITLAVSSLVTGMIQQMSNTALILGRSGFRPSSISGKTTAWQWKQSWTFTSHQCARHRLMVVRPGPWLRYCSSVSTDSTVDAYTILPAGPTGKKQLIQHSISIPLSDAAGNAGWVTYCDYKKTASDEDRSAPWQQQGCLIPLDHS